MEQMTPQQAAAVWANVPRTETALTSKVAGLSNMLTGLAFALAGLPFAAARTMGPFGFPSEPAVMLVIVVAPILILAMFFLLRSALWHVYGLARPGSTLGQAYDRGGRPGYRVWYLLALAWCLGLISVGFLVSVPDWLASTASLTPLVVVYTLTMGHWESRQPWSRRPYLLAIGIAGAVAAMALLLLDAYPFADLGVLGLAWLLSGLLLFFQA